MFERAHLAAGTFVAILLLLTAGCGFQPVYGGGAPVRADMAAVEIALIADRSGQLLRNELLDRLTPKGAAQMPRYMLVVELAESKQNLAIRRDDTATRANLILTAQFKLSENVSDDLVLEGRSRSLNSYNISTFEFATLSAETDARRRATRELAQDIATQLALYFDAAGAQADR